MCAAEGTAEALKEVHNSVRGGRCRETGLWLALVSADVTGERAGAYFQRCRGCPKSGRRGRGSAALSASVHS
jgi:hypothetical protein